MDVGEKILGAASLEMRRRLNTIAMGLGARRPDELAGQLALLINGAFVSSQILEPDEAVPLLLRTADALVAASRR